jgi:hypothetical protein
MENGNEDALNELVSTVGQKALEDALEKAGANNILVAGIIDGAEFGTSLGNNIASQLSSIGADKGCANCKCTDANHDFELIGKYKDEISNEQNRRTCFKNSEGIVFVRIPYDSVKIKENTFLENTLSLFKTPEYLWKKCGSSP